MNFIRHAALAAYYLGTRTRRRQETARRASVGTEPVSVLFYHRVADTHPNDWTIDTRTFTRQVNWLARNFDLVDLAEAQRRLATGSNSRPTVCITFDDGYSDNCRTAVPMLVKREIPFTYFVSTQHVLGGEPFPHDLEADVPLSPNTPDELRQMADAGVAIGAHTRTHADLGKAVSHRDLVDEIAGSKCDLETTLGAEVRYFAFPYGLPENMSAAAFQVAHDAGFAGVCSAYGGYNFPGVDPFHLRRIHGDRETIRLKNWLTVDPRKLDVGNQFQASPSASAFAVASLSDECVLS